MIVVHRVPLVLLKNLDQPQIRFCASSGRGEKIRAVAE